MATPQHVDAEIVRKMLAEEIPPTPRFVRFITEMSKYKPVEAFHFDDCGCDDCGAYRRVGIG